jgi:hypothetical protein
MCSRVCERLHALLDVSEPLPCFLPSFLPCFCSLTLPRALLRMSGCDIFAGQRACACFFVLIEAKRGAYDANLQVKHGFTGAFKRTTPVRMSIHGNGDGDGVPLSEADLVWYQCGKAFRGFKQ